MAKVTLVQVYYNNRKFVDAVFGAMRDQTYQDKEIVVVISGNDDGGKEYIREKFPEVTIIDPGYNIGFAKGHNLVFEKYMNSTTPSPDESGSTPPLQEGSAATEFFQLVNPDLVMEPDYVEKMVEVFNDPKVGAVTGKLYQISNFQYPIPNENKTKVLDSTGVTISKSGRARDRGQHQVDEGQYDGLVDVQAVSGAGCMYRSSALEAIRMPKNFQFPLRPRAQGRETISNFQTNPKSEILHPKSEFEYFDEDFHSYWEDVDLAWRMVNAGWKCKFEPKAVAYHGRGAGSSKRGYADVLGFIKHHKNISSLIKQLNYQNHFFLYLKNSKWFYPQFFIREFFMLGYIVLFEISTLKVIPEMYRLLPEMWEKRKLIRQTANK